MKCFVLIFIFCNIFQNLFILEELCWKVTFSVYISILLLFYRVSKELSFQNRYSPMQTSLSAHSCWYSSESESKLPRYLRMLRMVATRVTRSSRTPMITTEVDRGRPQTDEKQGLCPHISNFIYMSRKSR